MNTLLPTEFTRRAKSDSSPLTALEVSGAICPRVIHDLSNLISGILGNADYANGVLGDPARLEAAVKAISQSASSAGQLLGKCLPLQKLVSNEAIVCDARELAAGIASAGGYAPDWQVNVPPDLEGCVRVQPRWFCAAVWQLVRETGVKEGEMEFQCGAAVFPVMWRGAGSNPSQPPELFQVTLRYRAESVLMRNDEAVTPERPGLLAAQELIRRFKGQIHSRPKPPGRQEISILIQLAHDSY